MFKRIIIVIVAVALIAAVADAIAARGDRDREAPKQQVEKRRDSAPKAALRDREAAKDVRERRVADRRRPARADRDERPLFKRQELRDRRAGRAQRRPYGGRVMRRGRRFWRSGGMRARRPMAMRGWGRGRLQRMPYRMRGRGFGRGPMAQRGLTLRPRWQARGRRDLEYRRPPLERPLGTKQRDMGRFRPRENPQRRGPRQQERAFGYRRGQW